MNPTYFKNVHTLFFQLYTKTSKCNYFLLKLTIFKCEHFKQNTAILCRNAHTLYKQVIKSASCIIILKSNNKSTHTSCAKYLKLLFASLDFSKGNHNVAMSSDQRTSHSVDEEPVLSASLGPWWTSYIFLSASKLKRSSHLRSLTQGIRSRYKVMLKFLYRSSSFLLYQ